MGLDKNKVSVGHVESTPLGVNKRVSPNELLGKIVIRLKPGIVVKIYNNALVFFRDGQQEFFFSVPAGLDVNTVEDQLDGYMVAKGFVN